MSAAAPLTDRFPHVLISPVPDGAEAYLLRKALDEQIATPKRANVVVFVARDDAHLRDIAVSARFFANEALVLELPAWDCLPYDRISPQTDITGRRLEALFQLARLKQAKYPPSIAGKGVILLTTINAFVQRVVPEEIALSGRREIKPGDTLDIDELASFLAGNGYLRSGVVNDPGEFAIRGGIIDIFPTGQTNPVRLDLFGDEVENIKRFDALTQKSIATMKRLRLFSVSEVDLSPAGIERFRTGYRKTFTKIPADDPLYAAISEGRRYAGMEHWQPLFFEKMATVLDYIPPQATILLSNRATDARRARQEQITDFYNARAEFLAVSRASSHTGMGEQPYLPLPWQQLYWEDEEFDAITQAHPVVQLSPFRVPEVPGSEIAVVQSPADVGEDFVDVRQQPDANLFAEVRARVKQAQKAGKKVIIAGVTTGSRTRLTTLVREGEVMVQRTLESFEEVKALEKKALGFTVLPIERGFTTDDLWVLTETDILGERLARPSRKKRRAEDFLSEAAGLEVGDLVVHIDHGVGRFDGLMTVQVGTAPHDVLKLVYAGDDKLYVPVENIEVLSRYGSGEAGAGALDRLGGGNWQARRAKLKKRLKKIAEQLIKTAAARALRKAEVLEPMEGTWDEFCARFPYAETDDQLRAIEETLGDLAAGKPMDRLVCGDVGFGKTEIAIRAAFVAAMTGKQVAVVVPTTLLSRQHMKTFDERLRGFPIVLRQLSRLVSPKDQKLIKDEIESGHCDVVIGTHALLAESINFKDLGLLVIDEEQRFGVKQKERLKSLRETVHVLTLSATPIPRTLQLAMSGVKELSLIATPPVDRLAVRTFVTPWDGMVIREALMREQFRGGQSFVVCPRLRDLEDLEERLQSIAPELKVVRAHGQLQPSDLERVMTDFYDRKYDVLLSTNIVESGIDIPSVNTLIIHRADMFGLSGLYQLRGRVGRSKQRGYAYLTLDPRKTLTPQAKRRLEVMSTLDTLGAGFTLASHDLDLRGAGNLVGEEQSGHIKEVGIELYQQMLEEAVRTANLTEDLPEEETGWSPRIDLGIPVLIPETFVHDLPTRLGLYRRLGNLETKKEVDGFAAELTDRFGSLPQEVENLLRVMEIKRLCRVANIEQVDVGPNGAVITLRNHKFPKPQGLLDWLNKNEGVITLRKDQKLVYRRSFENEAEKVVETERVLRMLAKIATG